MDLFNKHIQQVHFFLEQKISAAQVSTADYQDIPDWYKVVSKPLVMNQDTAVELGNPNQASSSFLLWSNQHAESRHQKISIVGNDFGDIKDKQVPFGKIVIIGGNDFDEENSSQRYRALEKVRYDVHLEGYMMRGASQFQREWSRVSSAAVVKGFSLKLLGKALMDKYLEFDFVNSVEIIFVTSSLEDVLRVQAIANESMRIIGAMNKMVEEMAFDCDSCEYVEVCSEVEELRSIRETNHKERGR